MAAAAGLSPEGLDAGLDVVVGGVRTVACRELLRTPAPAQALFPALAVLSANVPGLALQCLLPALAARRPLLLKTPSAEPGFAPWLLSRLAAADTRLEGALAAATWRGGDRAVEDELLPRFERVIAYGGDGAMRDLGGRGVADGLIDHGHRISLGLVLASPGATLDLGSLARGLARDVALFDQRGCLSVHAVLVVGTGSEDLVRPLADALRDALATMGTELPPGRAEPGRLAAVRAAREEAIMAGYQVLDLPGQTVRHGSILVHPADEIDPVRLESPGLRCVRIASLSSSAQLWNVLDAWRGRLQGIALSGKDPTVDDGLCRLGVTRIAPPGRLQEVDAATWRNGGRDPLEAYAGVNAGVKT